MKILEEKKCTSESETELDTFTTKDSDSITNHLEKQKKLGTISRKLRECKTEEALMSDFKNFKHEIDGLLKETAYKLFNSHYLWLVDCYPYGMDKHCISEPNYRIKTDMMRTNVVNSMKLMEEATDFSQLTYALKIYLGEIYSSKLNLDINEVRFPIISLENRDIFNEHTHVNAANLVQLAKEVVATNAFVCLFNLSRYLYDSCCELSTKYEELSGKKLTRNDLAEIVICKKLPSAIGLNISFKDGEAYCSKQYFFEFPSKRQLIYFAKNLKGLINTIDQHNPSSLPREIAAVYLIFKKLSEGLYDIVIKM